MGVWKIVETRQLLWQTELCVAAYYIDIVSYVKYIKSYNMLIV